MVLSNWALVVVMEANPLANMVRLVVCVCVCLCVHLRLSQGVWSVFELQCVTQSVCQTDGGAILIIAAVLVL